MQGTQNHQVYDNFATYLSIGPCPGLSVSSVYLPPSWCFIFTTILVLKVCLDFSGSIAVKFTCSASAAGVRRFGSQARTYIPLNKPCSCRRATYKVEENGMDVSSGLIFLKKKKSLPRFRQMSSSFTCEFFLVIPNIFWFLFKDLYFFLHYFPYKRYGVD